MKIIDKDKIIIELQGAVLKAMQKRDDMIKNQIIKEILDIVDKFFYNQIMLLEKSKEVGASDMAEILIQNLKIWHKNLINEIKEGLND